MHKMQDRVLHVLVSQGQVSLHTASLTCSSLRRVAAFAAATRPCVSPTHVEQSAVASVCTWGEINGPARRSGGQHILGRPVLLARALPKADTDALTDQVLYNQLTGAVRAANTQLCLQLYEQLTRPALLPGRIVDPLLRLLCSRGPFSAAWMIFRELDQADTSFSYTTLQLLMSSAIKSNETYAAYKIFQAFPRSGLHPNLISYCTMISALCRCRQRGTSSRQLAYELWGQLWSNFDHAHLDAAAYRTGMNACVSSGRLEEAKELLVAMQAAGHVPESKTYNILIKGYARVGKRDGMEVMMQQMRAGGVPLTTTTYNTAMYAHARAGDMDKAAEVFAAARADGVPADVRSFATLIDGYAKLDNLQQAMMLLEDMKAAGVARNAWVYSGLVASHVRRRDLQGARQLLDAMREDGVVPNTVVYNTLLQAYADLEGVKEGGQEGGKGAGNAVQESFQLLRQMRGDGARADVQTYNTLMVVCCKAGQPERAVQIFGRLKRKAYRPDAASYTILITALADMERYEEARRVFDSMQRDRAARVDVAAYNAMIDAMARQGDMDAARDLLRRVTALAKAAGQRPPVQAYGAVIGGYSKERDLDAALEVVKLFYQEGGDPDRGMFDSLVELCMRSGEFKRALQVVRTMERFGKSADKRRLKALYKEMYQGRERVAGSKRNARQRNTSIERFKFWLGLPNSYYNDTPW